MKFLIIVAIALVVFFYFKGKKKDETPVDGTKNSVKGSEAIQHARIIFKVPNELPINWASHHAGLGYVGDSAIINCEYLASMNFETKHSWTINLLDIARYSVTRNQNNKWIRVNIHTKEGYQEYLILRENELASFEEMFNFAVQSAKEMEEILAQG